MRNASILLALIAILTVSADARVTRLAVEHRAPGPAQQSGPAYETLTGHFTGELDPRDPLNAIVTDLAFAPRNARGMVEYTATFAIARPSDMANASGVLFYQVPNRGNGSVIANARGDVSVISGWQGDLAPRAGLQTISVPVAHGPGGSPLTGPALVRFVNMRAGSTTLPMGAGIGDPVMRPPPLSLDTTQSTLTRRASENGMVLPVPASDWAFADCSKTPFPGTPDPAKVCLKGGFDPLYLYQLVYTAKDPLVLGIGYAATRDLNSFLRYEAKDDTGTANPLAGHVKWALAAGTSQSGNYLRSLIHLGFNQDERGRIVFEGANTNIAARQNPMNFRFAVPGGAAGLYEPGSEGPVWWADYEDKARGLPAAGLLDRCRATETCPKIVETFGSSEFWGLRMSPDLVGTDASADIPLPPNVRRYYNPGVTHGGGRGGFALESAARGCLLPDNPNPASDTVRAITAALIDWVTTGAPPPGSRYPRLDRGDLVPATREATGFPAIPGFPLPDNMVNTVLAYDFGSGFNYRDLSGVISLQPPVVKGMIPTLVPRVDSDGNETSGIPSVLHRVPLGTYLGWNVMLSGFYKGSACGFQGGYIPFVKTKAERAAKGDPRPSLEERYGTHERYVELVKAAAARLVADRFLLPVDAERLIHEAEASNILRP